MALDDDDDDKLFYVMVDWPKVSEGTEVPITENPRQHEN